VIRIRLVAVGKLKEPHFKAAADEYLKRLQPYARVEVTEVADRDVTADEAKALAAEGADLLRALGDSPYVIALDLHGPERTSEEFADWIEDLGRRGSSDLAFVIGGAAGLAPSVLQRADATMSLSRMTLPHQLCRVVFLEQLYRAFKIARNEPYHR
jgi:23S rRNA (pseudouridine1915-N3)-methyltransferase